MKVPQRKQVQQRDFNQQQTFLLLSISLPPILIALGSLLYAGLNLYLLSFLALSAFIALLYVVFSSRRNIEKQQQLITNLLSALIEEDYTMRGNLKQDAAIAPLLSLINKLADDLQSKSRDVREKQLLLDKILNQIQAMLFAYDDEQNVVMANTAAKTNLFLNSPLAELDIQACEWLQGIAQKSSGVVTLQNTKVNGQFFVFKDSYISNGTSQTLVLIIKAEQILDEKKQQAWQDLLRVLSHELNNSLTPIATISRSLNKKVQHCEFEQQAHFAQGLGIISERANSLQSFISSYRELAQLPQPSKRSELLVALFENITALFEQEVVFTEQWQSITPSMVVNIDKKQVQQVLINLLKNAIEANGETQAKKIEIDGVIQNCDFVISIRDFGEGIANFENLFVPFYSTKAHGTGLGLALSRQIIFNHGGSLVLSNHVEQGAVATLSLPLKNHDNE